MGKTWKRVGVLAALACLAGALAVGSLATAEVVTVGNLRLKVDGGFSPKVLPKKSLAPIGLTAEGAISTVDGTHVPAIKEFLLETDKDGAIFTKGYPVCTSGKLQSQLTAAAKAACKSALIGSGTTTAEVELADSKPILVNSQLLVFNGGEKGGTTTLFIHAYFSKPIPGAIVTTVKIKKINKGPYGLLSVASIPKIAGGAGSVVDFKLKIDKKFTYKGKKVSVLSAKCSRGKLQAYGTAVFADGTRASADFVRPCTGKG